MKETLAVLRYALTWRLGLGIAIALTLPMGVAFAVPRGPAMDFTLLPIMATTLVMAVFLARPAERATLFEAALPVSARQIFVARTLSRLLVVGIPGAILLAVGAVASGEASALRILAAVEVATLSLFALQCLRPRQLEIARWSAAGLVAAVVAASATLWALLSPPTVITILALANAATLAIAWRAVPRSYETAPVDVARWRSAVDASTSPATRWRSPSWWLTTRNLVTPTAIFIFVVSVPSVMAGAPINSFALYLFVPMGLADIRRRSRWMTAFPVSPRRLFHLRLMGTIGPMILGTALGYALRGRYMWDTPGLWLNDGPHTGSAGTFYRTKVSQTAVTLDLWRRAPDGIAPVIVSPTGESRRPPTISILGISLYNPYDVDSTSSDAFVDWQFARATTAMYGRPIPRQQAHAETVAFGRPLTEDPRYLAIALAGACVLVLYLIFVIELAYWHRLRRPEARWRRLVSLAVAGAPVALLGVADYGYSLALRTNVVWPALLHLGSRVSLALHGNWALVLATAALPVAAMYAITAAQGRRAE